MALPDQLKGITGVPRADGVFQEIRATIWFPGSPSYTTVEERCVHVWDERATEAFETLKKAMVTLPVLALPDFSLPFVIETDASGTGLGAVLSQNQRPIAYFSHTLSNHARAKSVYERELMAVVLAVQRWRPYLLGQKFLVRTDQQALKHLLEQRVIQPEYQRWISKLLGYDFEIQYRPGLENKAADALSRIPLTVQLAALSAPAIIDVDIIRAEVAADPHLAQVIAKLEEDEDSVPKFSRHQGMLRYKGRMVISKSSKLIPTILHMYHDSVLGGHSGFL